MKLLRISWESEIVDAVGEYRDWKHLEDAAGAVYIPVADEVADMVTKAHAHDEENTCTEEEDSLLAKVRNMLDLAAEISVAHKGYTSPYAHNIYEHTLRYEVWPA